MEPKIRPVITFCEYEGKVHADTRNPFIASVLEILEITENRYSGIPTIYKEMEKAGLS